MAASKQPKSLTKGEGHFAHWVLSCHAEELQATLAAQHLLCPAGTSPISAAPAVGLQTDISMLTVQFVYAPLLAVLCS